MWSSPALATGVESWIPWWSCRNLPWASCFSSCSAPSQPPLETSRDTLPYIGGTSDLLPGNTLLLWLLGTKGVQQKASLPLITHPWDTLSTFLLMNPRIIFERPLNYLFLPSLHSLEAQTAWPQLPDPLLGLKIYPNFKSRNIKNKTKTWKTTLLTVSEATHLLISCSCTDSETTFSLVTSHLKDFHFLRDLSLEKLLFSLWVSHY